MIEWARFPPIAAPRKIGGSMRPMPELEIVELPINELVEYENNAKLHPHEQVDQIANSISEFGNNDPIAVWHNEAGEPEIVEGHGRLMALRKLGIQTVPVIYLDHLTDEQRRAYALAHNKLTMNSDFDFEILADELAALESFDMTDFGFQSFEMPDIDNLFVDAPQDEPSENVKTAKCPECGHVFEL